MDSETKDKRKQKKIYTKTVVEQSGAMLSWDEKPKH